MQVADGKRVLPDQAPVLMTSQWPRSTGATRTHTALQLARGCAARLVAGPMVMITLQMPASVNGSEHAVQAGQTCIRTAIHFRKRRATRVIAVCGWEVLATRVRFDRRARYPLLHWKLA